MSLSSLNGGDKATLVQRGKTLFYSHGGDKKFLLVAAAEAGRKSLTGPGLRMLGMLALTVEDGDMVRNPTTTGKETSVEIYVQHTWNRVYFLY